jgi:hypothetical protein
MVEQIMRAKQRLTLAFVGLAALGTWCPSARASYYPEVILSDNPTIYWRLNDASNSTSAADSAPLGGSQDGLFRHGFTPGGVTNGVAGIQPPPYLGLEAINTASSFNGAEASPGVWDSAATDNIRVDTPPTLFGNAYSAEFWFNDRRPFDQRLATGYMFSRLDINSPGNYDAIGLTGTDLSRPHTLQFYNGGGTFNFVGTTVLSTGTWYHVVFVRNNSSVQLYLDGVLDGSATVSPTYGGTSNTFIIGIRPEGSWTYQGLLDEMSIYNYALTPTQVAAHYNASVSIPEPAGISLLGLLGAILLAARRR